MNHTTVHVLERFSRNISYVEQTWRIQLMKSKWSQHFKIPKKKTRYHIKKPKQLHSQKLQNQKLCTHPECNNTAESQNLIVEFRSINSMIVTPTLVFNNIEYFTRAKRMQLCKYFFMRMHETKASFARSLIRPIFNANRKSSS